MTRVLFFFCRGEVLSSMSLRMAQVIRVQELLASEKGKLELRQSLGEGRGKVVVMKKTAEHDVAAFPVVGANKGSLRQRVGTRRANTIHLEHSGKHRANTQVLEKGRTPWFCNSNTWDFAALITTSRCLDWYSWMVFPSALQVIQNVWDKQLPAQFEVELHEDSTPRLIADSVLQSLRHL